MPFILKKIDISSYIFASKTIFISPLISNENKNQNSNKRNPLLSIIDYIHIFTWFHSYLWHVCWITSKAHKISSNWQFTQCTLKRVPTVCPFNQSKLRLCVSFSLQYRTVESIWTLHCYTHNWAIGLILLNHFIMRYFQFSSFDCRLNWINNTKANNSKSYSV